MLTSTSREIRTSTIVYPVEWVEAFYTQFVTFYNFKTNCLIFRGKLLALIEKMQLRTNNAFYLLFNSTGKRLFFSQLLFISPADEDGASFDKKLASKVTARF